MFSDVFLAQTRGEMNAPLPPRFAYMACHFSLYGRGLSNLPDALPPDSILLLDDSTPPNGHDPDIVARQLTELVNRFSVKAVLLDFQNAETEESRAMVAALVRALPKKIAVTEVYAKDFPCSVFLSPTPVNMSLETHLSPWLQQGVFLEIAPDALQIAVTEKGSFFCPVPVNQYRTLPLTDHLLHCHYQVEASPEKAIFTLQRTKEDLTELVRRAYTMGILGAVGLYRELIEK